MNPADRRNARQYALQALYQWQVGGDSAREIEVQFITHQITKNLDMDYFKEILHAVIEKQSEIDAHMTPFLKRPIQELDPIELSIMRLSIYELTHRIDIPYRVVINEALELTKKFGSIEGYKFVNGVLDQIARKSRAVEVAADAKKKRNG